MSTNGKTEKYMYTTKRQIITGNVNISYKTKAMLNFYLHLDYRSHQ